MNSITGEELATVTNNVKQAASVAGSNAAPDANVPDADDDGDDSDSDNGDDSDSDNGDDSDGETDTGNSNGLSFELTTGVDEIVGTAGDDTFTAKLGDEATLNEGDSIDGKGGNDTLKLNSTGETMPTVKNVENVYFIDNDTTTEADSAGKGGEFNVSAANEQGFEQIWVENVDTSGTGQKSESDAGDGYNGGDVTFGALKDGQVAGLKGRINTAGSDSTGDGDDGKAGSVKIGADGVTAQTVALDGVYGAEPGDEANIDVTAAKDLTVDLSGDNAADIDGSSLKNVTFTGEGSIDTELTGDALAVDASATTGGVEVAQSFAEDSASFQGGSGDDTLDVDLADGDPTKKNAIDMGGGYNTISVQVAKKQGESGDNFKEDDGNLTLSEAGYNFLNNQDNVDEVNFNDKGNSFDVVDAEQLKATNIGLDDNITVKGLTDEDTVIGHAATDGGGLDENGDLTSWTYDYTLQAKQDDGVVNFHADEADEGDFLVVRANTADDGIKSSNFGTLNLTGKGDVHFSNNTDNTASGNNPSYSGNAQATTIKAEGYEGKLTFEGSKKVDTITVGSGGSEVTQSDGEDVYTFGDGADTYVAAKSSDAPRTSRDVINNFNAEDDTIDMVTNELDVSGGYVEQSKVQAAVDSTEGNGLKDALEAAAVEIGYGDDTKANMGAFEFDGSTYVVAGSDDDFGQGEQGNFVLELTGSVDLTAENFDLTAA